MSRCRYNADACPYCSTTYGQFRTGLTYRAVFEMLMDWSADPRDWHVGKTRGPVLGKWFEIKRQLWQRHVDAECERHPKNVAALAAE